MKRIWVNGVGGFIRSHLVRQLRDEGFWVRGVDLKHPEFSQTAANECIVGDLRNHAVATRAVENIDDIYQLAADMGGAGYIFTGEHGAAVMHNPATIGPNNLDSGCKANVERLSIRRLPVFIRKIVKKNQRIGTAAKIRRTLPLLIANMVGEAFQ